MNKRGLMLIEVIIGFALIGILLIPITTLFVTTYRINQQSRTIMTYTHLVQQHMEYAKLERNIDMTPIEVILSDKNIKILRTLEPHPDAALSGRLQKVEIVLKGLEDDRELMRLVGLRRCD